MEHNDTTPAAPGITPSEIATVRFCIDNALSRGASDARVSLGKNTLDSISLLNGEIDKVTRCADRGLTLTLFADGRYGTFTTNSLDRDSLPAFIGRALETTRMLAPDPCRCLPRTDLCARNALTGDELGLSDPAYTALTAPDRLDLAVHGARYKAFAANKTPYRIVSEECEWSDSTDDSYIIDSQGFEGRHRETSFNFWTEITLEDARSRKYTGYHWESSPFLRDVDPSLCSPAALERAAAAIGPKHLKSGKYTLVVENTSASRLLAPILNALSANAIQQNNSFLAGTLGSKVFPEGMNIFDFATAPRLCGSRLFDSEGLAARDRFIIHDGVVEMYFVNTYMSKKMGLEPTIEGSSRPTVLPFPNATLQNPGSTVQSPGKTAPNPENTVPNPENTVPNPGKTAPNPGDTAPEGTEHGIDLQRIMDFCGDGVLVTGFNGGNCNGTTGNFSYGVEGFLFKNGRVVHPIKETLVTGNMITLWNSLLAAGSDPKSGTRWQVPTLAFSAVDFSA